MKLFKQIEIALNISVILSCLVFCYLTQSFETLITCYIIVGFVQLLGMLVHAFNGWFVTNRGTRWIYHWATGLLLALIPTGISLYILVIASPFLALFYLYICHKEYQLLKHREFVHLK
jgi:hypothetical protein